MKFSIFRFRPFTHTHTANASCFFLIFFLVEIESGFGQTVIYEESFVQSTVSQVFVQPDAQTGQWSQFDLIDIAGWQASDEVLKTVADDGSFSIVNNHVADSRYEVQASRPKATIADQNGIHVINLDNSVDFDLAFGDSILNQLPDLTANALLAKIGKFPGFQPPTFGELAEWAADGWSVDTQTTQQTTLSRAGETMEIMNLTHVVKVSIYDGSQLVQTINQYFGLENGEYLPGAEVTTEFLELSNGDCAHRVTTTIFSERILSRSSSRWPSAEKPATGSTSLTVFPDPVADILTVVLPETGGLSEIRIVNQMGQLMRRLDGNAGQPLQIDVSDLPPGIYFLTVSGPGSRQTVRFSKN